MKTKFFLIGLFSGIVLSVLIFFGFIYNVKHQQKQQLEELSKTEIDEFEITTITLDSAEVYKLALTDVKTGDAVSLKQKRFVFINFWATWCQPCVAEIPGLNKLVADPEIKALPIQFLFANNEKLDKQKEFIAKNPYTMSFCQYKDSLPKVFDTNAIPATYIIDTQNDLAYKTVGSENWNSTIIKKFLKSLP